MRCNVCGVEFDPADLTQVVYHETHRPVPIINDVQGEPVRGKLIIRPKKEYQKPSLDKNDPLTDLTF